jgi:hypothetical protein
MMRFFIVNFLQVGNGEPFRAPSGAIFIALFNKFLNFGGQGIAKVVP